MSSRLHQLDKAYDIMWVLQRYVDQRPKMRMCDPLKKTMLYIRRSFVKVDVGLLDLSRHCMQAVVGIAYISLFLSDWPKLIDALIQIKVDTRRIR